MTSVLNHRLPLSGSNILGILLMIAFLVSSCSSSKEVFQPERDDRVVTKSKKRPADARVDTVQWTKVSSDDFVPIEYDGTPRIEKKEAYQAALMIPFNATQYNQGENTNDNERFIQFYGGLKLGLEDIEESGISLSVDVFDTEGSERTFDSKIGEIDDDTDIIIGPYERSFLGSAADLAKNLEIPLVSPWQSSSRITKNNPYYIQLRPALRDHYDKMVEEALRKFKPDQIIILKKEDGSDDNRVNYLQQVAGSILQTDKSPLREFAVNTDSLILSEIYFTDLFEEDREIVFLIQNYSFDDEDFIYNTLRKLSAAKGLNSTTVYGLPILLDTEKIDFNIYKVLNTKVVRSRYVDPDNERVKSFRSRFVEAYGALPTDEAYYGYDIITYFSNAMHKYGTQFQFFLDQHKDDLLQVNFDIQKSFMNDGKVSDDFRDVNYFVNKHLDIIEFDNNQFKVADRY